jgi:hypothetical protein
VQNRNHADSTACPDRRTEFAVPNRVGRAETNLYPSKRQAGRLVTSARPMLKPDSVSSRKHAASRRVTMRQGVFSSSSPPTNCPVCNEDARPSNRHPPIGDRQPVFRKRRPLQVQARRILSSLLQAHATSYTRHRSRIAHKSRRGCDRRPARRSSGRSLSGPAHGLPMAANSF